MSKRSDAALLRRGMVRWKPGEDIESISTRTKTMIKIRDESFPQGMPVLAPDNRGVSMKKREYMKALGCRTWKAARKLITRHNTLVKIGVIE